VYLVSGLAVALVLWPLVRPDQRDSFPLSTYSMFSFPQDEVTELPSAVAVVDGEPVRLSPELIGGTEEVIVAFHTVRRAIRAGPDSVATFCADVADRVRAAGLGATAVQVVTERHDSVAWFDGDREALEVTVHGECPV
jgi:hypothetical protein